MQEESGATITIDEVDGVGKIQVSAPNKTAIDAARAKLNQLLPYQKLGEVYEGTVRSIMPYGCFVEILPGKDGLLHISEIDWKHLATVEEAGIKEGDKISVKLLDIDPKTGKYKTFTPLFARKARRICRTSASPTWRKRRTSPTSRQ